MNKNSKIYVAGHRGLVGSAILRELEVQGYTNILTKTSKDLDLRDTFLVDKFFETEKPEYVFLCAAKVGGIGANMSYPVEFLLDNLSIQNNVISTSYKYNVKKLLFLGSSCIYPKNCLQPMKEEYLLDGKLEPTNEGYALAKISGLKLCEYYRREYGADFISAMPTNIYGIGDNFDINSSHVIPALINRFHEAKLQNKKELVIWGTGKARREFMYSDDLAKALIYLMNNYSKEGHINVGTGKEIEIIELARIIKEVVGFEGEILKDLSKPDGMMKKLLDISKLDNLGFKSEVDLKDGIKKAYEWFLSNQDVKR
ncbi:MAG: GDP-L-fucose synthase family protein [Cetobacterium sp.]|uniref:GDP-L-fucose synthase family protein n=1 Tax=Cetobacterium sp. TaxID=2071632 RepID=UPI003F3B0127